MPENTDQTRSPGASPLAGALGRQAEAQIEDLRLAKGLGGETFDRLADRADQVLETLAGAGANPGLLSIVRDRRGVLRSVARLVASPSAGEIPPSNLEVYAAVLDVTELSSIVAGMRPNSGGAADRLLRHLAEDDEATARRDRLTLGFAAVCRRGGLSTRLSPDLGAPVQIEIDRWPIAAAAAVPLSPADLAGAAAEAGGALREAGRPGLIVLETGALMPWSALRVADDQTAIAAMHERLDAFMVDIRDTVAEAAGTDHAFGLVVHATLPATNVASRRLLFAECLRAVNLCDADDVRIAGFESFIAALSKAERRQAG
jgi:hypothetical protein